MIKLIEYVIAQVAKELKKIVSSPMEKTNFGTSPMETRFGTPNVGNIEDALEKKTDEEKYGDVGPKSGLDNQMETNKGVDTFAKKNLAKEEISKKEKSSKKKQVNDKVTKEK